ncbi:MAG: DMT family transporter [Candidatus Eiseniibacteriota bacterium]
MSQSRDEAILHGPRALVPYLLALTAIVLWGISFVATKAALAELAPIPLVVARFALGLALLLVIAVVRRPRPLPTIRDLPELAVLGFFGIFVHQMLQANALRFTSAVNSGWLVGLTPLWSALLAVTFLRERLTRWQVTGLLLGFVGALLVITRGRFETGWTALPSTRGDLLMLASSFNWSLCTILGRRALARHGALVTTIGSMLAGFVLLVPFFVADYGFSAFRGLSPGTWTAVLFLGFGCSGVAYLFWFDALERLDASRVSAFLYIEPLVTLVAAAALLGEPIRAITVAGGLILLFGVGLVQRATAKAREKTGPALMSGKRLPVNDPTAGTD